MIYKMYATLTTSDSIATIDIQNEGTISGVEMILCPNGMDALSDSAKLEVSFMSSNTFTTNDARGSIAMLCLVQNFLTNGGGIGSGNLFLGDLNVFVSAGERIHMHATADTGVGGVAHVYLHVDDGVDQQKQRTIRRRR